MCVCVRWCLPTHTHPYLYNSWVSPTTTTTTAYSRERRWGGGDSGGGGGVSFSQLIEAFKGNFRGGGVRPLFKALHALSLEIRNPYPSLARATTDDNVMASNTSLSINWGKKKFPFFFYSDLIYYTVFDIVFYDCLWLFWCIIFLFYYSFSG